MMITKLISEQKFKIHEKIDSYKKNNLDMNNLSPQYLNESISSPQIKNNSYTSNTITNDLILDIINQSLDIPSDKEYKITWNIWDIITEPILKDTKRIENELMFTKLNEFGLHKDSEENSKLLYETRRYEENQCVMISNRINELELKVKNNESKRMKDLIKYEDIKKKRYKTNWISVYEELANERGPWGTLENSEVLFNSK